ncbi:acetolactate synthase 2 small subunit [Haemophilus parainfluenzae]|uniref:acetolactate synthase 2 small subunit n=1 Tax=Haemophilus parainfluenzae TaxID=729 RepID=UPI0018A5414A|nr:acetolactate synthase 2 small subunit [Haemophilus parainfluenzae]QOR08506.1 acetolactate synthase 2 small subunit [Haemophilus parainfluenzae]
MNQYTFDLIAQHRPEVLERVLRVIRLRGFTVTNMDMTLVETQVQLKITVKSDRTFDLLVNQLAKLLDVLNVDGVEN